MMRSISSKYKFRTIKSVRDRPEPNKKLSIDSIKNLINVYAIRGL